MARPVVGGHFAILALEQACQGNASASLHFLDVESDDINAAAAAVQTNYEQGNQGQYILTEEL